MIAKKFLIENGREKTKILVVYPPAVELYFQDRSAIFAAAPSYSKRSVEGEGAAALQ